MKQKRINFIPIELREKRSIPHGILPVICFLIVMAYCGGSVLRYSVVLGSRNAELKELRQTSLSLSTQIKEQTEQNFVVDKNDKAVSAIQKVVNRKNYWSEIFKELSMLVPDGIWLTHFTDQLADPKSKTLLGKTQLSLSGEADSQEVVAHFLTVLEKSHHFAGVQMNSLEREANIEPARYKFHFTVPVSVMTHGGGG